MSERLEKILKENAEFEKKSPYNFCDRWCERCPHEMQVRCRLYLDEFERKASCIAHGRAEDDSEITEAVMEAQYKQVDDMLNEHIEKVDIDLDNPDIGKDGLSDDGFVEFEDLPAEIQKHIRFVENNPLDATAKEYRRRANDFLEKTFYKDESANPELRHNFETISWYHTLLEVKLHRALCGFHEPASEGDISLCDAVAQFQICQKAIKESLMALKKIKGTFPSFNKQIIELLALLCNISSRIDLLLQSI